LEKQDYPGHKRVRSRSIERQFVDQAARVQALPAHRNQRELESAVIFPRLHVRSIDSKPGGPVFIEVLKVEVR
jgi:hypothetical protein